MARPASSPILEFIRQVAGHPRLADAADHELLQRFVGERDEAAFTAILRRRPRSRAVSGKRTLVAP